VVGITREGVSKELSLRNKKKYNNENERNHKKAFEVSLMILKE